MSEHLVNTFIAFATVLTSIITVLMVYLWGWVTGLDERVEKIEAWQRDENQR